MIKKSSTMTSYINTNNLNTTDLSYRNHGNAVETWMMKFIPGVLLMPFSINYTILAGKCFVEKIKVSKIG